MTQAACDPFVIERVFDAPRETYTRNLMAASLHPDPEVQAQRREARRALEEV